MYKNWKAICEIADKHFMWAIALLDLASDFGKMIASKLPEYFTDEPQTGPIPLSMIRMLAEKESAEKGFGYTDCLVSYCKYWGHGQFSIPILDFTTDEDGDSCGFNAPMLPSEIQSQIDQMGRRAEVGDTFIWEGKKIVLLENNDEERGSCFLMHFAPADCVLADK